jgi:hypothetical protein
VHEGVLVDMSATPHPGFMFAFNKEEKFTLREWAVDGAYVWKLQTIEELQAITCFEHSAAIEDSRYRQVTFEATTPDCIQTVVRVSEADDTVTETWTFTVWPDIEPPVDGSLIVLEVDAATGLLPSLEIN